MLDSMKPGLYTFQKASRVKFSVSANSEFLVCRISIVCSLVCYILSVAYFAYRRNADSGMCIKSPIKLYKSNVFALVFVCFVC